MTTISVILPLFDAAGHLPLVLPPLLDGLRGGELLEVIVVDDGSADDGPRMCGEAGLEVVPSGGRALGPGAARNVGARIARGDLLLFIDSDVVMHAGVPARVRAVLDERPGCVAVFGSYDDRPRAAGVITRYRNLLHHWVHHHGKEDAGTFWAGCGAVRREAFLAAGGFDVARYPRPSIEDIELGHRLRRLGRILLRPEIQGTHLKRWTLRSMIATDVWRRALPWSRLLLEPGCDFQDLNVTTAEKLKAIVAGLFWLALLALPLSLLAPPPAPLLALGAAAALLALAWAVNAPFFALVRRQNGVAGMLGAVLLHQLYYLYSTLTYVYCVAEAKLGWTPR